MIGLVVVDKEAGWTSHDVVARCRKLFGERRVGHAGTLDPDATGLLLVGIGRATRLLRFLTGLQKSYTGELVLGVATSTLDSSGEVTGRWDMSGIGLEEVRKAAAGFVGEIEQVPPMVSAIKIGGKRLHQLARQGIEVERPARFVSIYRLEVESADKPGTYLLDLDCSAGTYVRSLAADLGTALGGGGHLRNLRRTRVGSFSESEAHTLDEIAELGSQAVLTPAQTLRDFDRLSIDADVLSLVSKGVPVERISVGADGGGPWALVDERGQLAAVYETTETDLIRPAVVLSGD